MRQRGLVGDGCPVGRLLGCEKGVACVGVVGSRYVTKTPDLI
jgi:hypothetical protein